MYESNYFKIKVTVPKDNVEEVRNALGRAGAGQMGNYEYCSYSYPVMGKFRPIEGANPTIGKIGELETVEEECIECICHKDILESAIAELKRVHPYEEPAIDIMPRFEL
ncbi:MAG TPA: hypothetical protein DEB09_03845 [Candidatus Magasanikbacteria bacterium]|nr:hypothetical protein [Candidatus Magasanikbacteria bacterium]